MYGPPCKVCRGLNSRSRVDSLPFLIIPPTVTSMILLVTALPPESTHITSGWTVRPSTTFTLQVSVSISPAVIEPFVSMDTTGAVRAVDEGNSDR